MITFLQAYRIAKEARSGIDTCTEYQNGYVFERRSDTAHTSKRPDRAYVVRKIDGSRTSFATFLHEGAGKEIRSFRL